MNSKYEIKNMTVNAIRDMLEDGGEITVETVHELLDEIQRQRTIVSTAATEYVAWSSSKDIHHLDRLWYALCGRFDLI